MTDCTHTGLGGYYEGMPCETCDPERYAAAQASKLKAMRRDIRDNLKGRNCDLNQYPYLRGRCYEAVESAITNMSVLAQLEVAGVAPSGIMSGGIHGGITISIPRHGRQSGKFHLQATRGELHFQYFRTDKWELHPVAQYSVYVKWEPGDPIPQEILDLLPKTADYPYKEGKK